MEFKTTSTKRSAAAFSLVEMVIALAISSFAMLIVGTSSAMILRGFSALDNYIELEQDSRYALDIVGRDIRQATALATYTNNAFTILDGDGNPVTYQYTDSEDILVRTDTAESKTLLTGCELFSFNIYQRNTISGSYDQYETADVDTCKLIQLTWKCSRKNLSGMENTEFVQSAKFVIRKQ